jgi:hypothetical protein
MPMRTWIILAAAASTAFAAAPAGADSASVEIKAEVPSQCNANVGVPDVVTTDPLLVTISVERVCNATHQMSVTYQPAVLSAEETFAVTFDGAGPDVSGAGMVKYTNLPPTNSTKTLTIAYAGPAAEGNQIASTVVIAITAP